MKAYGCGRGRIYRELQPLFDPDKKKPAKQITPTKKNASVSTRRKAVLVTDLETGDVRYFEKIGDAAEFLGCDPKRINDRLSGRIPTPWRGRYIFARPEKVDA